MSSKSPSDCQSVGVLGGHRVIQHSTSDPCWIMAVFSRPGDCGSRATSRDTGEGELRAFSIKVRVHSEGDVIWYINRT